MRKRNSLGFFLLLLLTIHSTLIAEVESIIIRWNPIKCQTNCPELLAYQFKQVYGVAEVYVGAGQAELKWKPNVLFSLPQVKVALQMVGISIVGINVRVRVRGKLQHQKEEMTLISSGDNTRFVLLNPVVTDLAHNRQAPEYNYMARQLTLEMRQQLLEAEAKHQIATIEGVIFMPERSPPDPLAIVIDQMKFTDPKEDNFNKQKSPYQKQQQPYRPPR
jgi:hypothetical protein